MPELANRKHELYARQRAGGLVPARAIVAAGYVAGSGIGTQLEADPLIKDRIQELCDHRLERREQQRDLAKTAARVAGEVTGLTQGWIIDRLKDNAVDAAAEGDFKNSNEALKMLGEAVGLWRDDGDGKVRTPEGGTLGEQVLDRITAMPDNAMDILDAGDEPLANVVIPSQRQVEMIAGPKGANAVAAKSRELTGSGSEVDAAMAADALDDWDDEDESA